MHVPCATAKDQFAMACHVAWSMLISWLKRVGELSKRSKSEHRSPYKDTPKARSFGSMTNRTSHSFPAASVPSPLQRDRGPLVGAAVGRRPSQAAPVPSLRLRIQGPVCFQGGSCLPSPGQGPVVNNASTLASNFSFISTGKSTLIYRHKRIFPTG